MRQIFVRLAVRKASLAGSAEYRKCRESIKNDEVFYKSANKTFDSATSFVKDTVIKAIETQAKAERGER